MRSKWIMTLALCLAAYVPAFGQTFGDITGLVSDSSGAVIAGTNITITNVGTNASRTTVSNESGAYAFPALQPGTYSLRAEKQGFKAFSRTNITVEVQSSGRIDIALELGAVTETVEVSAQAALLQSENATVGTVIDNKRILELPLAGRNAFNLVALAPNVSFGFPSAGQAGSRQGGIRADQSISVGGQRSQYNRYTLDGVENTDPNFNTFVVLPSVDALQEFKVQSGIYPAEFGRGATQINMSTKSGSNDYHGTLFYFLRNDKLDAKNFAFTAARPPKDPFKWNQFGFTLGGPISIPKIVNGKNRLFFMTNYEWFRQRRQVQAVSSLPSAAMQGGNFDELTRLATSNATQTAGIFDPRTRTNVNGAIQATAFPGNVIPASRINSISKQLLEFYPVPNNPTADLRNNFVQAQGRPVNRDQFIGRFDVVESSNSQWSGRYSWGDENQLTEALKLNGSAIVTTFKQYMVSNTRVLSASMVNEARFGYTSFYNTNGPELAFTRDVVSELKIPGLNGGPAVQWGIPNVSLQGVYAGFGNDSEGPYENNNSYVQFVDNFSVIRGKHSFKFGGEIRQDRYNQVGNQFARGQFTFTRNATQNLAQSGRTGDPMADFLLGETFQAEAAVSIANAKFRATGFAMYVDDIWKVSSKLTINAGLRYEFSPTWEDQTGTLFNGIVPNDLRLTLASPNAPDNLAPFFQRQGAARSNCYEGINLRWPNIAVKCDGSLGNRLVALDKNDWAPRLGISYSPSAKWVLRAGAGIFYSQDSGNPRFDMARNLAGRLRDNSNQQIPNLNWANALASVAGGVANVPRPYTFANPYDRRTPYTQQFMFNIQRELPMNTVFEIGYLGSVSHHLEALRAVNEALPSDPRIDKRSVPERSPFPNFGRIQLVDNGGNGNYHSLGTKLTKRYSNGLTALFSYTFAKSIDTATAIRNQGGDTLFPQNSYCRSCERGRSSHDVRHRFVTSALWDVPFGKGRKHDLTNPVANAVAGGWQASTIITLQGGFPITVTNGLDTSNVGGFFDRPNATGQTADLPRGEQNPSRFFNTGAFVVNNIGEFGNVGRNTLNSPGIIGWDFSMLKNFHLASETKYLQLRFEWFNFPNHPNWGNPNTNVSSGGFGQITGTRNNMRQLQMGLKLNF